MLLPVSNKKLGLHGITKGGNGKVTLGFKVSSVKLSEAVDVQPVVKLVTVSVYVLATYLAVESFFFVLV